MPLTLDEMAAKGKTKFRVKLERMKANYDAAKSRMKAAFDALPFGPITKRTYGAGVDAATYRIPDVDKWERNWKAGVSR